MFALQLPTFRIVRLRGTNAARGAGTTPAARHPGAPAAAAPAPVVLSGAALDPRGLRVVPLRPDSTWPLRHGYDRVASPFRAFPYRSVHLSRMMSPVDPRD